MLAKLFHLYPYKKLCNTLMHVQQELLQLNLQLVTSTGEHFIVVFKDFSLSLISVKLSQKNKYCTLPMTIKNKTSKSP